MGRRSNVERIGRLDDPATRGPNAFLVQVDDGAGEPVGGTVLWLGGTARVPYKMTEDRYKYAIVQQHHQV